MICAVHNPTDALEFLVISLPDRLTLWINSAWTIPFMLKKQLTLSSFVTWVGIFS